MPTTRVAVFFGGPSPEHEVSVITGMQAAAALGDNADMNTEIVYVSKGGRFFVGGDLDNLSAYQDLDGLIKGATEVALAPGPGRSLRLVELNSGRWRRATVRTVDCAFLAFHGGMGENGAIQGLCESLGVPYTGAGVMASSLGMDKVMSKVVCRQAGVSVVDWVDVREPQWDAGESDQLDRIESSLSYPMIVKPVHLGSSIGIARVEDRPALEDAIDEAFRYDAHIMVEACVPNLREINCSVLGTADSCRVSVLEEPVSEDDTLSFEDKYMRNPSSAKTGAASEGMASLDRRIPAPIPDATAETIRSMARTIFESLDLSGVVRIDFLMDDDTGAVYFNEVNTIPGSLSFYLWEPSDVPFSELVSTLVTSAIDRFENRIRRVRTYDVNLLAERAAKGLKGGKS